MYGGDAKPIRKLKIKKYLIPQKVYKNGSSEYN